MGSLILASERVAEHPYYVEELDINLYTGEELCYYIYNNLMLIIGEDFVDEKLYHFLGEELGLTALVTKLRRWSRNARQSELLLVILQDIHYYRADELRNFQEQLGRIARATPEEQVKQKADYLMKKHRYYEALNLYDRLLPQRGEEPKDREFAGRIWYDRGSALASIFSYDQAVESYKQAYLLLEDETVLKKIYQISRVDELTSVPAELMNRIPDSTLDRWEAEYDEIAEQVRYGGKALDVSCLKEKDKVKQKAGMINLVLSWKNEYRRSLG